MILVYIRVPIIEESRFLTTNIIVYYKSGTKQRQIIAKTVLTVFNIKYLTVLIGYLIILLLIYVVIRY